MERLFNDGWQFVKLPSGSSLKAAESAAWRAVDLPHDFLIAQENNLYETADGWYRRTLAVPEEWLSKAINLRFDGVYMDCDVLLNGEILRTHHYGYTCFDVELTGRLRAGENTLHVHIRHQSPNSRWYSGAGIYRDVTLHVLESRHIALDGTYVTTSRQGEDWTLTIETELTGEGPDQPVVHRLLDGEAVIGEVYAHISGNSAQAEMTVPHPRLWSVNAPCCYTLETICGAQVIRENVGFREIEVTTDHGLFVNGEHVKLHGVCLHHDLGCLGSAFNVVAARRQLQAMKEMGVNSLRTSHNPPAKQMMDLCDEMGILVVDEAFDMWQHPKTTYDYARFFDTDAASDVAAWVRRDRNHPCLLMWSIGNEIGDTNNQPEQAAKVTQMLCENVRRHDPKGNGLTTIGSNYMPWAGAQHCAQFVQTVGYNYGEKLYGKHHAEHPEWVIYGSETASTVASRGIYHFPMNAPILTDDDLQCSCLGNSNTSWGTQNVARMIADDLNCPYSLGQYIWTGIDYIGEPTPYHTRNSYFGAMDTALFPKDYWYLYKAMWADKPMVHIGVHWDWNPGQLIDVPVMVNAAAVELFLNGESLGVKAVDLLDPEKCWPVWQVAFAAGELKAVAYDAEGAVMAEDIRFTPDDTEKIVLQADRPALTATGSDLAFVTIYAEDAQGRPVENACDRVHVSVTGQGMLMGVDNGDSTDRDGYKTTTRRLFSGKLLAVIGDIGEAGTVHIKVTSPGKEKAVLELPVTPCGQPTESKRSIPLCREEAMPDEIPVRKIELIPLGEKHLTPEHRTVSFRVQTHPVNAMPQEIHYRITNAKGIESPCAAYAVEGDVVTVTGLGDGIVYLRASCCNGYDHARVISQQDILIEGLGQPNLDPYGFISGGLYTISYGELTSGNEQGVAFARDGESMAGFTNVDFGPAGSDEINLPIFALDSSRYNVTLWDGHPREGGEIIAVLPYQKPSRWNVYQPETYKLPRRLTGLHTLCFTMDRKIHLKGFSFTKQSRAWMPLSALQADAIYGDSFTRTEDGVTGIGNNVSLVYENMDFGDVKEVMLTIDGCTPLKENPITIRIQSEAGETVTTLAQFKGTQRGEQSFAVEVLPGVCAVSFIFLPGCQFDFYGFRFRQE
ncbi:MAG: DUF4982 domain-containing protein [Clostridia bacterium]|nr:DUF4982 domain-containing protein [Clostridia bacterium]